MDLVGEEFDHVLDLEAILPLLHCVLVLVLGGEHGKRNRDVGGVLGVNHGRVSGGGDLELGARGGDEVDNLVRSVYHPSSTHEKIMYLAAPAEAENGPRVKALHLADDFIDDLGHARYRLGRRGRSSEELAKLLLLLVVVGRVPRNVGGVALEPIGHEDLVFAVVVGRGEDVGALERLREESENVVDDQDGMLSVRRTGVV